MKTVLRFSGYMLGFILWNAFLSYIVQFISIPTIQTNTFLGCLLWIIILMCGVLFISSSFIPMIVALLIELRIRDII